MAMALCARRGRLAALTLLVAPPLEEWLRRGPALDPVRWTCASIADDVAYGAGVWRGCVEHRTVGPLRPRIRTLGADGPRTTNWCSPIRLAGLYQSW
jgi:hypothetical protein